MRPDGFFRGPHAARFGFGFVGGGRCDCGVDFPAGGLGGLDEGAGFVDGE